jgi:hypothetical protein
MSTKLIRNVAFLVLIGAAIAYFDAAAIASTCDDLPDYQNRTFDRECDMWPDSCEEGYPDFCDDLESDCWDWCDLMFEVEPWYVDCSSGPSFQCNGWCWCTPDPKGP